MIFECGFLFIFVETKQKNKAMTKQTKKMRKQILQSQILRLAKMSIQIGAKDERFMRIINMQCEKIREKNLFNSFRGATDQRTFSKP